MRITSVIRPVVGLAALLGLSLNASAQTDADAIADAVDTVVETAADIVSEALDQAGSKGHPLTAEDLEAFMDGFIPHTMASGDVAGSVLVVVKDGEILFKKGYGYADLENKIPVDPDVTLFRPGSVSKLFTWTAVMQLVEQGKIDLDADINTYLDYEITAKGDRPITMRDVMTHTAGFEESVKGLMSVSPQPRNLEETLKLWIPERMFEPGTTPAYSNYATALAGYVVQLVSGMPFEDYIDQNIFAPLGMERSTFRQPVPEHLIGDLSNGYAKASTGAVPFEHISLPPAGSMSATAVDMAQFMLAHLKAGKAHDAKILSDETMDLMHDSKRDIMAPLNAMRLGFYDSDMNGHHIIEHGGDTQLFHSLLALMVDDGVGIFFSYNSSGALPGGFRGPLMKAFTNRYFPAPDTEVTYLDEDTQREHQAIVAGDYLNARAAFSSFLALSNVLTPMSLIPNPDLTISMPLLREPSGAPRKYREVEPFVWQNVNGQDRIKVIVEDGRAVRMSADLISPIIVLDKAPALRSPSLLMPLIQLSLVILTLTALQWPVAAIVRRNFKAPFRLTGARKTGYRLVRLICWIALAAMTAWVMLLLRNSGPAGIEALSKSEGTILFASFLTLIGVFGGWLISLYGAKTVFAGPSGWFGKLWSIALVFAFTVLVWVSYIAKLVSFSTNF